MKDLLMNLELPDFEMLVEILRPWTDFGSDDPLPKALQEFKNNPSDNNKKNLSERIEYAIGYWGSNDFAYLFRYLFWDKPGVTFDEIVNNVAKKLKIKLKISTLKSKIVYLTIKVVSKELSNLPEEKILELLKQEGFTQKQSEEFIKKHGRNLSIPVLVTAFGYKAVQELIKKVIITILSRHLGKETAKRIFQELAKRFPWWAEWIGPVAWLISGGWLALDIAGPAYRKTTTFTLYLGICLMRIDPQQANIQLVEVEPISLDTK